MKQVLLPIISLLVACGALAGLAEPPGEPVRGPYMAPLLPRIEFLKVIGAGQQSLVTDYFWLQAIQAAGRAGESLAKERWLDLYYYADLVTDLDPKFYKVYAYAGNAVPTNLGRETYVNVDEGIHILEKGVRVFPDDWRLNFYYATQISYLRKEHAKAAKILARVAKMEGAPAYVSELASRMLALQGDFDTAMMIADAAAATEQNPDVREVLERRKLELAQERVLQEVDHAVQSFRGAEGRMPKDVSELVQRGYLGSIPIDPMNGVIFIGEDGRAYSSAAELRFEAVDYEYRRKQKYGDTEQ